jgi:hypothetical protein
LLEYEFGAGSVATNCHAFRVRNFVFDSDNLKVRMPNALSRCLENQTHFESANAFFTVTDTANIERLSLFYSKGKD